jgi:hypothetical protein
VFVIQFNLKIKNQMENAEDAQEIYDQSFIEQPAILQKHQAAAVVVNGKYLYRSTQTMGTFVASC